MNLANQKECLGKEHLSIALSMNNIGIAYENKGEYEKVLNMYQSALQINGNVFGNDSPDTKIHSCNIDRTTRKINNNQS